LVKFGGDFMIDLGYSSGDDTPVLVAVLGPGHGEGLSSSGLAVTENSAVITLNY
jgi:hypothetical protein